jgi:predicted transcriptional regulator
MLPTAGQIRAARGLLGWSQRDLAKHAGLHQNGVYRTEKDDSTIRPSTVNALARTLEEAGIVFLPDSGGLTDIVARRKDFIPPEDPGQRPPG